MRQIIKMAKNGQEITFVCSVCGSLIYDMFVPIGKKYEPDWNKIQEICTCGTRLVHRNPIIDDSDIDIYRIYNNRNNVNDVNNKNNRNNANHRRNRSEIYAERIKDLEGAISIDYFDMRLDSLKRDDFKIPNNIDYLMMECIKRNISHAELSIGHTNDIDAKKEIQERLNNLKQKYNNLSKKLEDDKDFNEEEEEEELVGDINIDKI